jgi:hypothetical protein
MSDPDFREEAAAAFEARKELGPDYERAVLESFVTRAASSIDQRVDARLAQYGVGKPPQRPADGAPRHSLALAIVSLALGVIGSIPLGIVTGLPIVVVLWAGIVGVNFAYAVRQERPPQDRR